MIAIVDQADRIEIKLILSSQENFTLLKNVAAEVGTHTPSHSFPYSDKLDILLKDIPPAPRSEITKCESVFLYVSEW